MEVDLHARFATIREARDSLGLPERWLREKTRAGELPVYQHENRWPRVNLGEAVDLWRRQAQRRERVDA